MYAKIFDIGSRLLHWLTGLFVHRDGGCCCKKDLKNDK